MRSVRPPQRHAAATTAEPNSLVPLDDDTPLARGTSPITSREAAPGAARSTRPDDDENASTSRSRHRNVSGVHPLLDRAPSPQSARPSRDDDRAAANDEARESLAPGRLLVAGLTALSAGPIGQKHVEALHLNSPQRGVPYTTGELLLLVRRALLEPRLLRETDSVGRAARSRPRLRGAYFDLNGPDDGIDALEWFRWRYGCTPAVAYSRAGAEEIAAACSSRSIEFRTAEELHRSSPTLAAALLGPHGALGAFWLQGRPTPVIEERALLHTDASRHFETTSFAPWDAYGLAVRRFVLAAVGAKNALAEHQLRTIDAYFDGIAQYNIWIARGVTQNSMTSELSVLRSALSVSHLDEVRAAYDRASTGLAAPSMIFPPPPRVDRFRRPSARRRK
jgi:hypothetical protein